MESIKDSYLVSGLRNIAIATAVVASGYMVSGCATSGNYGLEGGLLGAGAGAIIGNQSGDAGTGAIIGGLGGALIGSQVEKRDREERHEHHRR
ncbi:MAG: glycine zipper domain-containing protein [Candidatus Pacearchaeota archaeon]